MALVDFISIVLLNIGGTKTANCGVGEDSGANEQSPNSAAAFRINQHYTGGQLLHNARVRFDCQLCIPIDLNILLLLLLLLLIWRFDVW